MVGNGGGNRKGRIKTKGREGKKKSLKGNWNEEEEKKEEKEKEEEEEEK